MTRSQKKRLEALRAMVFPTVFASESERERRWIFHPDEDPDDFIARRVDEIARAMLRVEERG